MPKQKYNMVMRGARGMLGKQVVFKRRNGVNYLSAPPEVNENRKPTPGQVANRERFEKSVNYSMAAIANPEKLAMYKAAAKRNQLPQNVAFRDAFNAPVVTAINAAGYKGVAGDALFIQAKDDFKVAAVKVSIHNSANELIEEGAAAADAEGGWTYMVTQANAGFAGSIVKAVATDIPGNEGSLEVIR